MGEVASSRSIILPLNLKLNFFLTLFPLMLNIEGGPDRHIDPFPCNLDFKFLTIFQ